MSGSVNVSTANLLAEAARVVAQVVQDGRALDEVLQQRPADSPLSRPALQALTFGTVRWYPRLARWIDFLSQRPADSMQPQVHALLAVALHQLNFSHHPSHAVGNAAVEAVRILKQPRASGFVNAVLRGFLRDKEMLTQRVMQEAVGEFAHPQWWIDALREDWPDRHRDILHANNEAPPMWLRVNRLQSSAKEYLALLATKDIKGSTVDALPDAMLLEQPVDVSELPEFSAGRASVQDGGAQLAAHLLDARAGMRVLDACAAPGGKACHIFERTPDLGSLVMLDRSARRMKQVQENLTRADLFAHAKKHGAVLRLAVGDAGKPQEWWPDEQGATHPFDRILLDVPCSASGVIRRHPDIKLLRRAADIPALAREQLRLLTSLWPLLSPGGRLLYVSCSVLHAENGAVIESFLRQEPSARECGLPETVANDLGGIMRPKKGPGLQLLPGMGAAVDGFYYACLEKH